MHNLSANGKFIALNFYGYYCWRLLHLVHQRLQERLKSVLWEEWSFVIQEALPQALEKIAQQKTSLLACHTAVLILKECFPWKQDMYILMKHLIPLRWTTQGTNLLFHHWWFSAREQHSSQYDQQTGETDSSASLQHWKSTYNNAACS